MAKPAAKSGATAADLVPPGGPSAAVPEVSLPADLSYEQALAELEDLVARMEAGSLPLDQLLSAYRRGAALLAFCRGRLEAVEAQVKLLEDGQLQPWNEA